MKFIDLSKIDPNDPDVVKWNNKAKEHLENLLSSQTSMARKEYLDKKKNHHWRGFKEILEKYFGEMCWYSEKFFKTSPGDVDHFRPKNHSTDENGNEILTDGYWWLAYDYHNYRYSCENSNRLFKKGGKKDRFPLKQGATPAVYPNSNDENLLLDPCNKNDCDLIRCDEAGCVVAFSSAEDDKKRVEASVKVYNLNLFNAERKNLRIHCKDLLERYAVFRSASIDYGMECTRRDIRRLIDSKKSFSSFLRKFILEEIKDKDYASEIEELLQSTP